MAWEDRTPFDAIEAQFGISHDDVVNLMRKNLKKSSFRIWRERVRGRKTKHSELRNFKVGRHQSWFYQMKLDILFGRHQHFYL